MNKFQNQPGQIKKQRNSMKMESLNQSKNNELNILYDQDS